MTDHGELIARLLKQHNYHDSLEHRAAAALREQASLAAFGRKVLDEHREEFGDLDGEWLQETAIKCGLLKYVTVDTPCGDECRCAEYYGQDEWPVQCLRPTDAAMEPKFTDGHGNDIGHLVEKPQHSVTDSIDSPQAPLE